MVLSMLLIYEWAFDFHIGFKNLSFHIGGTHTYRCIATTLRVGNLLISLGHCSNTFKLGTFEHQCSFIVGQGSDELEPQCFLIQDVMGALGVVY
jgi:hypothetical protein